MSDNSKMNKQLDDENLDKASGGNIKIPGIPDPDPFNPNPDPFNPNPDPFNPDSDSDPFNPDSDSDPFKKLKELSKKNPGKK